MYVQCVCVMKLLGKGKSINVLISDDITSLDFPVTGLRICSLVNSLTENI